MHPIRRSHSHRRDSPLLLSHQYRSCKVPGQPFRSASLNRTFAYAHAAPLELEILDGEGLRYFVYYCGGYLQVNNTSRALPYTLEKYPTLLSPKESNDRQGRVRLLRTHGAAPGSSNRTRDPGL